MRRPRRQTVEYVLLLAGAFVLALVASVNFGRQLDNIAYDWIYRVYTPPAWEPQSIVLGIDEESYRATGGARKLRNALAEGLERILKVAPKAVAIDVLLPDDGDPQDDARLEAAIRNTPNVVLACDLVSSKWQDPLPRFGQSAVGKGHTYVSPDPVCHEIELLKAAGVDARWALSLEAFRAGLSNPVVNQSQRDLTVGGVVIPAPADRSLRIRYRPPDRPVPQISLARLLAEPGLVKQFAGKTVFLGVTAQTAGDRRQTPYLRDAEMPGVEIHANAFETIANRLFLVSASDSTSFGICLLLIIVMGTGFAFRSGWQAIVIAAAALAFAFAAPYVWFTHSTVLPFTMPVFSAWFSALAAGSYQYFVVRRRMLAAESAKTRYQQAMHFVTHEMRTPLTAIQGSSDLMRRYAMTEEKRKQIVELINSESKRLGRMIEIFLNVERLSAGQMELKKEPFAGMDLMAGCVDRVRPLAERKQIQIHIEPGPDAPLLGDRELMEYAFYNLLTNAVKYSPPSTNVTVFARRDGERVRISVQDQGIGMDQKEVRKIFQKFYRTKKAEESGEVGTGIGLSIVEQIITQHGGSIEVTSSPGRGSCFTLVLSTQKVNSMVESK